MKKIVSKRSLYYVAILSLGGVMAGCGLLGIGGDKGDPRGEVVGVKTAQPFIMPLPYGMVPIPPGTFHMGQADEDPASTQINFNKQVTIGPLFMDDTEITNNEYLQFTEFFLHPDRDPHHRPLPAPFDNVNPTDFTNRKGLNLYPDTTVWMKDFAHHMGDPLVTYYWSHPGYKEYPVVGVSWEAANYFGRWRTAFLNEWRYTEQDKAPPVPAFRLPSEAEWEYSSRGGRDMAKYPWGNPYIRNSKGCMLANFKPGRGNYYDDGFEYTAPVGQYFPNDYGLMDMSGNVSEWCLDDFNPSSVPTVWDLNPQFIDKAAYDETGASRKDYNARKVIRGGSWKDIAYFLETGTRTYEYKDSTRAYIGFRCVMTNIERSAVHP